MARFGVQPQTIAIGVGLKVVCQVFRPPTSKFQKNFFSPPIAPASVGGVAGMQQLILNISKIIGYVTVHGVIFLFAKKRPQRSNELAG